MGKRSNKLKYPKLSFLVVTLILAILLFSEGRNHTPLYDFIIFLSYAGFFIHTEKKI